jgi:hypothetical protein
LRKIAQVMDELNGNGIVEAKAFTVLEALLGRRSFAQCHDAGIARNHPGQSKGDEQNPKHHGDEQQQSSGKKA